MQTNRRNLLKGLAVAPAVIMTFNPIAALAQSAGSGVLRVAAGKPAGDLNPHEYKGLWAVQDLIFEPLVRYEHGGTFSPALASSWQLEDGGKLLRFKLRENVKFHDGTPWDAEAMVWNLDKWLGKERTAWMNATRHFASRQIVDDYTVEIAFKEPVIGLLNEFSFVRPSRFLSPKSVDASGNYQKPVGTGPWVEESAANEGSTFVRFEEYWGDKPSFERLDVKVLPDSRGRMAAIRAGDIDITGGDFLAPIKATEAVSLRAARVPVVVEQGTSTIVLALNPDRNAALKDLKVRQAINIGFDRQAISKVLYQGLAEPAGNLFPETVPHSGKRFPVPVRDVEAARRLLDEAGWIGDGIRSKDGKELRVEVVVSEEALVGSRSVAEVMQAQLGEIGIGISIRTVDHASRHSDIPARHFDMAPFITFGAPYEPFGTIIGLLLSSYENGVDGKLIVDPEHMDPLVNAAAAASEENVGEATQAIYDFIHKEVACMPLFYVPAIWAHSERVKGFKAPSTEYDLPFKGVALNN